MAKLSTGPNAATLNEIDIPFVLIVFFNTFETNLPINFNKQAMAKILTKACIFFISKNSMQRKSVKC
jgi:hypothetical protein